MNTKRQILIDNTLIKFIAYLLNFIVRFFGKILNIDHSLKKEYTKIVICKFKGMGSVIQCTPLIAALRKRYPNAKIVFVSTVSNISLLHQICDIDDTLLINDRTVFSLLNTTFRSWLKLLSFRPELYIDLEIYSNFSSVFTALSLAKDRFGFYLRGSEYRLGIYTHMMFFNPREKISSIYLQFASLLNIDTTDFGLMDLSTGSAQNSEILHKDSYIIINPNASDLRIERRWPENSFVSLITQINKKYPSLKILLIGSTDEKIYTQNISEKVGLPNVKCIAGETTIPQLINVIKRAKIMISNDTGPMHIAFSCMTPIICLFGPCSPIHYGFDDQNVHSIYKNLYCSPCVHDFSQPPCKGNNLCMKSIDHQEVFDAFDTFMKEGKFNNNQTYKNEQTTILKTDEFVHGLVKR